MDSVFFLLFGIIRKSITSLIATNSPNKIDPLLETGWVNSTCSVLFDIKIAAPAPHGPGFPLQEPSVKANVVFFLS